MVTVFHEILNNDNVVQVATYLGGVLYTVMNFCGKDKVRFFGPGEVLKTGILVYLCSFPGDRPRSGSSLDGLVLDVTLIS